MIGPAQKKLQGRTILDSPITCIEWYPRQLSSVYKFY